MRVHWFYVFDLEAEGRKKPIGAWILQDGVLDYVFDPAYPDDEAIPSDLINRMLEVGEKVLGLEGLRYWREHVGYTHSASQIKEEDVTDYTMWFWERQAAVTEGCSLRRGGGLGAGAGQLPTKSAIAQTETRWTAMSST
ncbi:MAG: hypothetical protein WC326_13070 [Candidatus Delongbacteria bacterium]